MTTKNAQCNATKQKTDKAILFTTHIGAGVIWTFVINVAAVVEGLSLEGMSVEEPGTATHLLTALMPSAAESLRPVSKQRRLNKIELYILTSPWVGQHFLHP